VEDGSSVFHDWIFQDKTRKERLLTDEDAITNDHCTNFSTLVMAA